MTETKTGALAGIRVLDLTHVLAGPFCGQLLADQGADVIKIEPMEGDFFRRVGPFLPDDEARECGGLFQVCNRNKRSLAINLKSEQGRELLRSLVGQADALLENFRAGVLDRMGLGYADLSKLNPRLVYTSIRGFGDVAGGVSPYYQWPAFDVVAQAMGGWMGATGLPGSGPVKTGSGLGDTVPALYAALGTLSALFEARQSGQGQYVDISMVDSVFATSENLSAIYAYTGNSLQPAGNGNTGLAPTGSYAALDGTIVLSAPHDNLWADLCKLIGRDDLLADPRLQTEADRWENRDFITREIEIFTRSRTKAELMELLGGKVPFGPVYTAQDIFTDPHFAARNMLAEVEQPGSAKSVKLVNTPVKMSRSQGGVRHRAPCIGEHNHEILAQFGLSAEDISNLEEHGAIGSSKLAQQVGGATLAVPSQ